MRFNSLRKPIGKCSNSLVLRYVNYYHDHRGQRFPFEYGG